MNARERAIAAAEAPNPYAGLSGGDLAEAIACHLLANAARIRAALAISSAVELSEREVEAAIAQHTDLVHKGQALEALAASLRAGVIPVAAPSLCVMPPHP